ncbi:MAG: PilN domain-containing protein [Candidatus Omnitrophota bacterium]|nr:MAG: PilN domain-containing protein [Candidatus Omnitrophota bacterium]
MIELNLLPEELKKKRTRIELPEIPLVPIAVAFLGILLIVQFIVGGFIFLSRRQLGSLNKKWENLAPKKTALAKLKGQITVTGKKVEAIEGLIEKQLNWSCLLNELSNSLTANIWLTELSYDERGRGNTIRTLTLSGSAVGKGEETTAFIAHFIKSLKDNKKFFAQFDNIELVSIKKGRIAEQDIMNFILICSFKPQNKTKG